MPALQRRRKVERSIAKRLHAMFAAVLGGQAAAGSLGLSLIDILSTELAPVYSQAFRNIAGGNLTNHPMLAESLGMQFASERAASVANAFVANVSAEAAAGTAPEQILSDSRASSLAVTEVTTAVTSGEAGARQVLSSGVPQVVRPDVLVDDGQTAYWVTVTDDRVCEVCEPLDLEPETDWRDQFPFGPPAHPNCRCHLEYIPADQDPTQWLRLRK